jgi:hypothetical protein
MYELMKTFCPRHSLPWNRMRLETGSWQLVVGRRENSGKGATKRIGCTLWLYAEVHNASQQLRVFNTQADAVCPTFPSIAK